MRAIEENAQLTERGKSHAGPKKEGTLTRAREVAKRESNLGASMQPD